MCQMLKETEMKGGRERVAQAVSPLSSGRQRDSGAEGFCQDSEWGEWTGKPSAGDRILLDPEGWLYLDE